MSVLFIFQIIIGLLLITSVLFQKTDEDSLSGIGGGASNAGMMPHKNSTSPLIRFTMWLFVLFMINSLFLAIISMRHNRGSSTMMERHMQEQSATESGEASIPEVE